MRKHNGMRPQDIVVLLKIISKGTEPWQNKDLAHELHLSASEVSESLNRSRVAGLINEERKKVYRQSLAEFIEHGLRYVFPVLPGGRSRGVPTAHSLPLMQKSFTSSEPYVWPDAGGEETGLAIEPLYKDVVKAVKTDKKLYTLLGLADVLRVGRAREVKVAIPELKKIILHE